MGGRLLIAVVALMALSGTPAVHAQGGTAATPEEAYLQYHQALKSGYAMDAVWDLLAASRRSKMERKYLPEVRDQVFSVMKNAAPGDVEVVDERQDGDRAELTLESAGDESVTGTAVLVREDDAWKIDEVVWKKR